MWIVFNFPGKDFEQVSHPSKPRRGNTKPKTISKMKNGLLFFFFFSSCSSSKEKKKIDFLKGWTYFINLHKSHWTPNSCIPMGDMGIWGYKHPHIRW